MPTTPKPEGLETHGKKRLWCSFCGSSDDEVDDLIAGPTVLICGNCISLCWDIIQAAKARRQAKESPPPTEKSEKDKTHE